MVAVHMNRWYSIPPTLTARATAASKFSLLNRSSVDAISISEVQWGQGGLMAVSGLDPADWSAFRQQGQKMLDDMFDYLEHVSERPVWKAAPDAVRQRFGERLPAQGSTLGSVHQVFMEDILPYAVGNAHPGFMGWVHGGGTPVGMLAEMLAAGLNANLGGRDQIPVEVERQIVRWMRELFAFPDSASGVFVTGSSIANLIGVLIARRRAFGVDVRRAGVAAEGSRLVAYA